MIDGVGPSGERDFTHRRTDCLIQCNNLRSKVVDRDIRTKAIVRFSARLERNNSRSGGRGENGVAADIRSDIDEEIVGPQHMKDKRHLGQLMQTGVHITRRACLPTRDKQPRIVHERNGDRSTRETRSDLPRCDTAKRREWLSSVQRMREHEPKSIKDSHQRLSIMKASAGIAFRSASPAILAGMSWTRTAGPHLELDWLKGGILVEKIPQWFIDFFLATRDIGAVRPGEADNCTMTTVEDNWCLYRIAQLARPERSLEIGIMRGSSSITIGKAYVDGKIDCIQTAVDIDPAAAEAASKHFRTYDLHSRYKPIVADSREFIVNSSDHWQFVFLDGDHHYETVALELAEAYNRTDPGGWILLHDTGSAVWGTNEDPGQLFFRVLDEEIGASAEMTWLDSTSCATDMKLRTSLGLHSTLPLISTGIAVGYGGLGIIRKIDGDRDLKYDTLMAKKPADRPLYAQPLPPASPARRAARRVASLLGI